MHYSPKGWSIESEGLPRIVLLAAALTERLMLQNDRILCHLNESRQQRLREALKAVDEILR